ncbi:cobalt-precorrin-5B (C(1))-methyltransferase CbiD [Lacrimispora sp.]|jgi:cobalt-precorrin-5B (C1)-methyltransferase|uniref:cobalt-precorrin-5B (C(1))-methyltransferase CbiD n=1 Tax=Lacrimispora sp. TaxID=2719234 RepID=UPI003217C1A9
MMEKKELRCGFTTGTCAAVAAKAAAAMLLLDSRLQHMKLMTPKGTEADLPLFHVVMGPDKVSCAVEKDAGDDPDVTNKALIFASVEFLTGDESLAGNSYVRETAGESGTLFLTATEGIGRVTKPGLSCPVGYPAINPVPRSMIFDEVDEIRRTAGYKGSLLISVWIPKGRELAEKTFNSRLGIVDGLSILGTTGIVKPMSEEALTATIRLELHMKAVAGQKQVILTPGNYGETFIKETLNLPAGEGVTISNFIRKSCTMVKEEGFEQVLFAGHIGKLIKVAGGVENTHSRYGDRRMEVLWDCARTFLDIEAKETLLQSNTMETAAGILKELGILKPVMSEVVKRIKAYMMDWTGGIPVEVVTFSNTLGLLSMTPGVPEMIKQYSASDT